MRRSMLFAAFLLSACVDDGGELARRVEATQEARANYSALALKNYALGNATGQGPISQVMDGEHGLQSLLCLTDTATRSGYHLSWYQPTGKLPPIFAGELVRALGSVLVGRMRGGDVVRMGEALHLGRSCPLPVLPEGWPVVVMRVTVPASNIASTARMETKAAPCPEGQVGAAVYSRNVSFDAAGKQTAGDWGLLHDTCRVVDEVEATAEPIQRAEPVALAAPLGELLAENMPDNCKRVTILARSGKGDARTRRFETCDFVEVAELAEVSPPPVGPRPPRPLPPPPPPCPASPVWLPPMSSAAAYNAAVAPYRALLPLPSHCRLDLMSWAAWPYMQTFLVNDERSGGSVFTAVREYKVRLFFSWSAAGRAADFTEFLTWPRQGMGQPQIFSADINALPPYFYTPASYGNLLARINGNGTVSTYRYNGSLNPIFTGPHTVAHYDGGYNGHFPIFYLNRDGDPLGNTVFQAGYAAPTYGTGGNIDERGGGALVYGY